MSSVFRGPLVSSPTASVPLDVPGHPVSEELPKTPPHCSLLVRPFGPSYMVLLTFWLLLLGQVPGEQGSPGVPEPSTGLALPHCVCRQCVLTP